MRPDTVMTIDSGPTRRGAHPLASMNVPARGSVTNAVLLVGAALVAASGLIHLYLWADGYRNVATIGPLFFVQGMAGLVLAVGLVAYPRVFVAAAGAAYLIATAVAFALSATQGLFGFMDKLDAPWASTSLIVECAGAVFLVAGGALAWLGTQAHGRGLAATTTRKEQP